jgi:hypothetical protein
MSASLRTISKGITVRYFYPGLSIMAFGLGLLLFTNIFLGAGLILVGIVALLSISGTLIDVDGKRIKPYVNFILFKLGSWESLEAFDKILLVGSQGSSEMASRGGARSVSTKSFEIFLVSNSGPKIQLKEFLSYKEAAKFLFEYSRLLGIPALDKYKAVQEAIAERKRTR